MTGRRKGGRELDQDGERGNTALEYAEVAFSLLDKKRVVSCRSHAQTPREGKRERERFSKEKEQFETVRAVW